MSRFNISKLLKTQPDFKTYNDNLKLEPHLDEVLRTTAKEVSSAIKIGTARFREREKLSGKDHDRLKPRFSVQGSFAYKTIVTPPKNSSVEVDVDLGVYFPFEALAMGQKPEEEINFLFSLISSSLRTYDGDRTYNWSLDENHDKPTCLRVSIPNHPAHIDLPIYGYPIAREKEITLALNKQIFEAADQQVEPVQYSLESYAIDAQFRMQPIDPVDIGLAHKDKGWDPSDSIAMREWVNDNFKSKKKAREVCRFIKGWRDREWPNNGGPSSILLLAAVLRDWPHDDHNMDINELLGAAIRSLPTVFNHPVNVPTPRKDYPNKKEDIRDRVSPENRAVYTEKFRLLSQNYQLGLNLLSPTTVNQSMMSIFGEFFPFDPIRIKDSTPPNDPVRKEKPTVMPFNDIPERSHSG